MISSQVIQEINVLDIVRDAGKKNKRLQAVLLSEIEMILGKESKEYQQYRNLVLDETNSFTRSVIRSIFGDIEYLVR